MGDTDRTKSEPTTEAVVDDNEQCIDELIDCIHDAACDGEGQIGERSLLFHLKKHKLRIFQDA